MPSSRKSKKIRSAKPTAPHAASNSNETEVREIKKIFSRHITHEDRRRLPEQDLQAIAGTFWGFVHTRQTGQARIRVFNPTLKKEGYVSRHTVILIANDDMPFLVDSITGELNRMGLAIHLVLHPIVSIARDEKGQYQKFFQKREPGRAFESWMYIEVDETPENAQLKEITRNLEKTLRQVRLAVTDWQTMRRKTLETLSELPNNHHAGLPPGEREEAANFLAWLEFDHFTFLGTRDYRVVGSGKKRRLQRENEHSLGILRDPISVMFRTNDVEGNQPLDMHQFLERKQLVLVTKSHCPSMVHRTSPMDAILIKRFDNKGRLMGERLFVGLFTSSTYSEKANDIPLVRSKISYVINKAGFDPKSHDGKMLFHILNTYPRDELFQISAEELYETAMAIVDLQQRQHLALFTRNDPFGRFVNCLIFVPRDQYHTKLRQRFQEILCQAFNGSSIDFNVKITDDPLAQIFIVVRTRDGHIPPYDRTALERLLQETSRDWAKRLQDNLVTAFGENQGLKLSRRYAAAFPDAYRDSITPEQAMTDIAFAEEVQKSGKVDVNLYRPEKAGKDEIRLKWFSRGGALSLSRILSVMRHMGLEADAVMGPYEIHPAEADSSVWIQDCYARLPQAALENFDLTRIKQKFEEGLLRAWNDEIESDATNQLILLADLSWREVVILRALSKYLRQAGVSYSETLRIATFAAHPRAAWLLIELFKTRHDPALKEIARAKKMKGVEAEFREYLNGVQRAEHDAILSRYLNVVLNILRTNYFQTTKDGVKPYLSFKLDSRKLDDLPLPRPMVEIFVYSPRMEGVHMRGGKVARGGIRWSDRREDFRTEVLSLMKAQMVKNTVIVPVGSKGGFVVKGLNAPQLQDGIFCYQTLIRGMLDITDNRKGEKIVPPPQVVRHDDDDPYLVVAADKGTAKFSDIANALSIEYGFWLGDAFASGGSAGYDHKEMGITARGGWEAVKRHFREMGKDIQKIPFTVVGVGDMSGDVFGNAMLLSKKIKLLAAFNHKHIFVDPDPDLAASFAERKRLYALPASQWSDYGKKALSKGGGIYPRDAKSLKLSKQAREFFGITQEEISPDALIRTILKAKVELLWFGGIGTYVKSEDETQGDAGDRTNDSLRVNAEELRAGVIGEGANLGMTQRARIAFARKGGRINTDAIDNSAGVDTSDHEVNIKILLDAVMQSKQLTLGERNKLLARMTDEVAMHVLRDNYLQTLAISIAQTRASELLPLHARLITQLERAGLLNRGVEALPDDEDIQDRLRAGTGLTRPELAVLMAYAKIALYNEVLASDLPENPGLEGDLFRYFPATLHETYESFIRTHRLRREIIATFATNSLVNRGGLHFAVMMKEKTGKPVPKIVNAYIVTRDVYGLRPLWRAVERLDDTVPAEVQKDLFIRIGKMIERTAEWYLNHTRLQNTAELTEKHRKAVIALRQWLEKGHLWILGETSRQRRKQYLEAGVTEKVADDILLMPVLGLAPEIIGIAGDTHGLEETAGLYFAVEKRFRLLWLRAQAKLMAVENHWQREAVAKVVDELYRIQAHLSRAVLGSALAKGKKMPKDNEALSATIEGWINAESMGVAAYDALIAEIVAAPRIDLAMLTLALSHLNSLTKHG